MYAFAPTSNFITNGVIFVTMEDTLAMGYYADKKFVEDPAHFMKIFNEKIHDFISSAKIS
jgi:hypothetical protein